MECLAEVRKNRSKKLNLEYGIRPIYYLSCAMGLWPFSIVYDVNGSIQKTQIRFIDAFWFLISISMYFTVTFTTFERIQHLSNSNLMVIIFNYLIQIMGLACGTLIIAMDMYNRNNIANILEMFTIFDNEVCNAFHVF